MKRFLVSGVINVNRFFIPEYIFFRCFATMKNISNIYGDIHNMEDRIMNYISIKQNINLKSCVILNIVEVQKKC